MNNAVHLHEQQIRIDEHIAYASGITGFQSPGSFSVVYVLISPDGNELARERTDTAIHGTGHHAEVPGGNALVACREEPIPSHRRSIDVLLGSTRGQPTLRQVAGSCRSSANVRGQDSFRPRSHRVGYRSGTGERANPLKAWHWESSSNQSTEAEVQAQNG